MESEPKTISFSKNGEDLGEAYELTDGLEDKALYPHVLIKNAEFSVNFGSQVSGLRDSANPLHELLPGKEDIITSCLQSEPNAINVAFLIDVFSNLCSYLVLYIHNR